MVRARVYTVKEFVDWFKRQVASEMGCRDVDVTAVGVYAGGALIAFKCDGKNYLAVYTLALTTPITSHAL